MTFLSPWALVWLGSIPVLIWLWRFAASRRQTVIPSLVPFEHLLRRPPTRRTRLIVNLLFWLQLAALILIALALAQPTLLGYRARTVLVLLDTSASMRASIRGRSPLEQAKHELIRRIARKGPTERFFLVTTAPVNGLALEPISDPVQLRQLVEDVGANDLGGNLSIAHRIGIALLGTTPDETLVLTDEPKPTGLGPVITFRSFGEPVANVAIVGVDAHEPLCAPAQPQVVVTVENFADVEQEVRLAVRQNGKRAAEVSERLQPQSRQSISVHVPEDTSGLVEVSFATTHNALSVDDHALISLRGPGAIPVAVASARPGFLDTIGRWLEACPRIAWKPIKSGSGTLEQPRGESVPDPFRGTLLITEHEEDTDAWPSSVMVFASEVDAEVRLTHWLIDPAHPIGVYLDPLETVATSLPALSPTSLEPVLWSVLEGRKVPLVSAQERDGRRMVRIFVDPTRTPASTPLVFVFLNSLRWLTVQEKPVTTGEPLVVGPLEHGPVRVQRPTGAAEIITHEGGFLQYETTNQAGRYQFLQGARRIERLVHFLDPVESNTMKRLSTWEPDAIAVASPLATETSHHSLINLVLSVLFALLLLEWVFYSRKGQAR